MGMTVGRLKKVMPPTMTLNLWQSVRDLHAIAHVNQLDR
jgi:hypothetical protein